MGVSGVRINTLSAILDFHRQLGNIVYAKRDNDKMDGYCLKLTTEGAIFVIDILYHEYKISRGIKQLIAKYALYEKGIKCRTKRRIKKRRAAPICLPSPSVSFEPAETPKDTPPESPVSRKRSHLLNTDEKESARSNFGMFTHFTAI